MRGHEAILAMRDHGEQPDVVFLVDFPCKTDWYEWGDHATVCVAGDNLKRLDLRFLVGCRVHVSGFDDKRVKTLFERCKEYCPMVAGGASPSDGNQGWVEVWHRN